MNPFFASLAARWQGAAAERGVRIDPPELDGTVAEELLQLARVVARAKERSFAPLATFTAGVAAERFRQAGHADPAAVAAYLRAVREALEQELPPG
ncbi:MAG: hypothetical protein KGJ98_04000 [Chloroflexota bacterium]|nr:hypothetical protein [Chloroflexota bacterium]MDE3101378.1 hypothetical protein [Chloroflexota bacterium]